MKIGFDLDKIFIDTPPLIPDSLIEKLYRKKRNGVLMYRIPSKKEQFIRKISHYPLLRPPIKHNLDFLRKITDKNNDLYLVSSRFKFLENSTKQIIEKYKLNNFFRELFFNYQNKQPHIFKNEVIKKLTLDKFVDDDLYLLKYIASKNNYTKLYWLNKKQNKKISNNIQAITNLSGLLK